MVVDLPLSTLGYHVSVTYVEIFQNWPTMSYCSVVVSVGIVEYRGLKGRTDDHHVDVHLFFTHGCGCMGGVVLSVVFVREI